MFMNKKYLLLAGLLLWVISPAIAQMMPPGFNDHVDDVPVDGGLSLLIAAGAGYGASKLKKKQANHRSNNKTTHESSAH
jgi:hypothetical protein